MTAISSRARHSLRDSVAAQATGPDAGAEASTAGISGTAATRLQSAAATRTAQAALAAAAAKPKAASAAQALEKRQAALATDLRAALAKAGIKLNGTVEFSVSSDGKVATQGTEADKAATVAFLKADKSQPSFASRIATQAQDALQLSNGLQQSAAVSQAARYGGTPGGVVSLYASLMQPSAPASAVFSLGATSSALTYPGSLAAKA